MEDKAESCRMPKEKDVIIELNGVRKVYRMGDVSFAALDGIDLQIRKGEFVAIMGPSGSGKSTAMNMIGCLDVPTEGSVYLDGYNISCLDESDLAQIRGRKIGFIFQKFNLISTLSALENVALPMMFQGYSKEKRRKRAISLLETVELTEKINNRPGELSGGQQQRVAVARSLANDPEVILADEPTGNLDSKTGKKVMEFIKYLNEKKGKTIIMVTHDANLAKYAQKIIMLKDGKIVGKKA